MYSPSQRRQIRAVTHVAIETLRKYENDPAVMLEASRLRIEDGLRKLGFPLNGAHGGAPLALSHARVPQA
jgi:hypothetical protein